MEEIGADYCERCHRELELRDCHCPDEDEQEAIFAAKEEAKLLDNIK